MEDMAVLVLYIRKRESPGAWEQSLEYGSRAQPCKRTLLIYLLAVDQDTLSYKFRYSVVAFLETEVNQ
jgi:hypothetical protein